MIITDEIRAAMKGKTWSMKFHLNFADRGVLEHRCDALQSSRLIVTPKGKGTWGRQVVSYHIDGDEREFSTIGDWIEALLDKGILVLEPPGAAP